MAGWIVSVTFSIELPWTFFFLKKAPIMRKNYSSPSKISFDSCKSPKYCLLKMVFYHNKKKKRKTIKEADCLEQSFHPTLQILSLCLTSMETGFFGVFCCCCCCCCCFVFVFQEKIEGILISEYMLRMYLQVCGPNLFKDSKFRNMPQMDFNLYL